MSRPLSSRAYQTLERPYYIGSDELLKHKNAVFEAPGDSNPDEFFKDGSTIHEVFFNPSDASSSGHTNLTNTIPLSIKIAHSNAVQHAGESPQQAYMTQKKAGTIPSSMPSYLPHEPDLPALTKPSEQLDDGLPHIVYLSPPTVVEPGVLASKPKPSASPSQAALTSALYHAVTTPLVLALYTSHPTSPAPLQHFLNHNPSVRLSVAHIPLTILTDRVMQYAPTITEEDNPQDMESAHAPRTYPEKTHTSKRTQPIVQNAPGQTLSGVFFTGDRPCWILFADKSGVNVFPSGHSVIHGFTVTSMWGSEGDFLLNFEEARTWALLWWSGFRASSWTIICRADLCLVSGHAPTMFTIRQRPSLLQRPRSCRNLRPMTMAISYGNQMTQSRAPGSCQNQMLAPNILFPNRECSTLELISPEGWVTMDGFESAQKEFVTCLDCVTLETTSSESGMKDFIAVGTKINCGACFGYTPPYRNSILTLKCRDDAKVSITALCGMYNHLISTMDQKIFVSRALGPSRALNNTSVLSESWHITAVLSKDHEAALSAARNLNGQELGGRPLRIDLAGSDPFLQGKTSVRREIIDGGETRASPRRPPSMTALDTISQVLATSNPTQLFEILAQIKLGYALFQVILLHRIAHSGILHGCFHPTAGSAPATRPCARSDAILTGTTAAPSASLPIPKYPACTRPPPVPPPATMYQHPPPATYILPLMQPSPYYRAPPPPYPQSPSQPAFDPAQRDMLMQVLSLTEAQINSPPPLEREQIQQLRKQFLDSSNV
ncbi:predicted protein [Postia placenta Mad-698-R]|nr:predicted protein [Postia placenta Mad-698-R]